MHNTSFTHESDSLRSSNFLIDSKKNIEKNSIANTHFCNTDCLLRKIIRRDDEIREY